MTVWYVVVRTGRLVVYRHSLDAPSRWTGRQTLYKTVAEDRPPDRGLDGVAALASATVSRTGRLMV